MFLAGIYPHLCSNKQELDLYYPFSHSIVMKYEAQSIRDSMKNSLLMLEQLEQLNVQSIDAILAWLKSHEDSIVSSYQMIVDYVAQEFNNNTVKVPQLPARVMPGWIEDLKTWISGHKILMASLFIPIVNSNMDIDNVNDMTAITKQSIKIISLIVNELIAVLDFFMNDLEEHKKIYTAVSNKIIEEFKGIYPELEVQVRGHELVIQRGYRAEIFGYRGNLYYFKDLHDNYRLEEFSIRSVYNTVSLLLRLWDLLDTINSHLLTSAPIATCPNH